jgi:ABC-type sugar transport system permease subunit
MNEGGRMHRIAKQFTVLLVVVVLVTPFASIGFAAGVEEDVKEVTAGSMIADTLIVRPVAIAACIVGSAFFIVSAPFAAAGDNIEASQEALVKKPFEFAFKRPLGDF